MGHHRRWLFTWEDGSAVANNCESANSSQFCTDGNLLRLPLRHHHHDKSQRRQPPVRGRGLTSKRAVDTVLTGPANRFTSRARRPQFQRHAATARGERAGTHPGCVLSLALHRRFNGSSCQMLPWRCIGRG